MQNLLLEEGDVIHISSARLPKGQLIKLQPHTQDFLDISNPKAVLETTLRSYSCLTVGDCIALHYNGRRYYIDVIEAKPAVSPSPQLPNVNVIQSDLITGALAVRTLWLQ